MVGAVEFLRKAKEICKVSQGCKECVVFPLCHVMPTRVENESDLVAKVMAYEVKINQPQEDTNE